MRFLKFFKKSPKRLYYPSEAKWYTRPRRSSERLATKLFRGGIRTHFTHFFKNAVYFTFALSLFGVVLLVLVFSSYFSVQSIEVVRQDFNIDSAAIKNQLKEYEGRNILFLPRGRVEKTIQEHFPEFSSVEISKVLPHTLKIQLESQPLIANVKTYVLPPKAPDLPHDFSQLDQMIKEIAKEPAPAEAAPTASNPLDSAAAKTAFDLGQAPAAAPAAEPAALAPTSLQPLAGAETREATTLLEQKFLLNAIGQAIFDQEENLELMTVTLHDLPEAVQDRQQLIPRDQMAYLLDSIAYLTNSLKKRVTAVEYLPVGREFHLTTDDNIVIWLTFERDYKLQLDKLAAIYEEAELNKEPIAYIDLRVREKVIYCLRGTVCDRKH